jgi:VIT1/CCC1 family predicted Fe2+/Mn2+ transporter
LAVVALLITPYFLFSNLFISLACAISIALCVVAGYTFYVTTAKRESFWHRFLEMAGISLAVAVFSFGVGWLLRTVLGI